MVCVQPAIRSWDDVEGMPQVGPLTRGHQRGACVEVPEGGSSVMVQCKHPPIQQGDQQGALLPSAFGTVL
jgi:hypothetical protein